jgi:acetylglutamate kinase
MIVLKVSGHVLQEPELRMDFAEWVRGLARPAIIVHGGGQELDIVQRKLGIPIRKNDGLRITDAETLDAALMVLSGLTNKHLVSALITVGVDAIGLSGIDASLIQVRKIEDPEMDFGYVGEVDRIRGALLVDLTDRGLCVVISPLSIGPDGQIFNVNADQVAIASSLQAEQLIFLSNVPGVRADGELIRQLSSSQIESYIRGQKITGGMIPKVRAGAEALGNGVASVQIADLESLRSNRGTFLLRHNHV